MLNKEEKRVFDMYILPQLKKFDELYFDMHVLYEDELELSDVPEGEYNRKVFPYQKVTSDMWDIISEVKKWVKKIRNSEYVKKPSFDEKWAKRSALREKLGNENEEIRKNAYKKGQELAAERYDLIKMQSLKSEIKKEGKIHQKAYKKGLVVGKEMYNLTDEQILRKAEQIKLEKKLGFKK